MKDKATIVETLVEKAEEYAKTSVELYKLKAIDKGTDIFAAVFSQAIVLLIVALFFLLITLGLCYYMGEILGKTHFGFFVVAGLYFLIGGVLYLFRNRLLDVPLNDFIIRQIFKEKKR
ncbi:phage holin family protein [Flavobacterium caeni]|uniref:Putative Holin-X, holin superfamily III n=1 Tax=Flavobacterium caeni TaxID=490189 RepID=A0A1G5CI34_9FLAO|nr:phage holin family protein [Flavobacterium caeni]SCY02073.1 Putative Holin-X, holin superfamily III [Flavobacterium caeni]